VADAARDTVEITLSVPSTLEDRVIDWLLARADVPTFASSVVYLHGADSRAMSAAEQVSGRQRRLELSVALPASALEGLLEDIARDFAATDIGYRVTTVLLSGNLRARPKAATGSEETGGASAPSGG
jgi:hypothetical protein